MSVHHPSCLITEKDAVFVKVCGCGVVHMGLGASTINLSRDVFESLGELMAKVSRELKGEGEFAEFPESHRPIEIPDNVIAGRFPSS